METECDCRKDVPDNVMTLEEQERDFTRLARRPPYPRKTCDSVGSRPENINRREFLKASAGIVAGAAAAFFSPKLQGQEAEEPPKSRVVIIKHPEVLLKEYMANPAAMREVLDRGITELVGADSPKKAWQKIINEDDFLALKYNLTGAPNLQTHTEIVDFVRQAAVKHCGVNPEKIIGYHNHLKGEYNELSKPFALPSRGLKTRLRRVLTDFATCIINLPVLKAHWEPGVSIALKNHLGSVNNPADFHGWREDEMPRSLPELNALEPIRKKTRLIICDATRPLWAGGPGDRPDNRWNFNALIFATDPVAMDAVGTDILEKKRGEVKGAPWPLTAARQMLKYAEEIGLGNAQPKRIEVVKITLI